jgi:hypothetical protein
MSCPECLSNIRSVIGADADVLGTLVPGGTAALSSVEVVGSLTFAPISTLALEVAGSAPGEFDALAVEGDVRFEFGAAIRLSLLDPDDYQSGTQLFKPNPGDFFDVVTANSIDAEFLVVDSPDLGNMTFVAGVFDNGDQEVLRITAVPTFASFTGDFDHDADVDADDLAAWQAAFGVNSLADADADGDSDSDGMDFLAWQRQLGSGLPRTIESVPEPATLFSVMFAAVGWRFRRGKAHTLPGIHFLPDARRHDAT